MANGLRHTMTNFGHIVSFVCTKEMLEPIRSKSDEADHEAKVTTPSRELWGHAPWKIFEFWVSETAFPGEIPTYTTH